MGCGRQVLSCLLNGVGAGWWPFQPTGSRRPHLRGKRSFIGSQHITGVPPILGRVDGSQGFRGYGNPAHPSLAGKVFSTTRVSSWSAQTSQAPPSWVGPCGCPHPGDSHSSDLCPRPGSLNSRQPWTWADFPAKGWTGSSITSLATYVCGTHAHGPCTRVCAHSHTPTDPLQAVSPPYTC